MISYVVHVIRTLVGYKDECSSGLSVHFKKGSLLQLLCLVLGFIHWSLFLTIHRKLVLLFVRLSLVGTIAPVYVHKIINVQGHESLNKSMKDYIIGNLSGSEYGQHKQTFWCVNQNSISF